MFRPRAAVVVMVGLAAAIVAGCGAGGPTGSLQTSARDAPERVSDRGLPSEQDRVVVSRNDCPRIEIREGMGEMAKRAPGVRGAKGAFALHATIDRVKVNCVLQDEMLVVAVRVEAEVEGGRGGGGNGGKTRHGLPIRVAVTTAERRLPYSKIETVSVDLDQTQRRIVHERNDIRLEPRQNNRLAYLIYVGFDEGPQAYDPPDPLPSASRRWY